MSTNLRSRPGINATVKITGGNGHGEGQFTAACSGATDNAGNLASPRSVTYDVVANISSSVKCRDSFAPTTTRPAR